LLRWLGNRCISTVREFDSVEMITPMVLALIKDITLKFRTK